MHRAKLVTLFAFLLIVIGASRADDLTLEKQADIQALIKISGADQQARRMGLLVVQQMSQAMRESRPDLPARAFEIVEQEVKSTIEEGIDGPDGLIARLVPVYGEFFEHQEIEQLLAFHRSPIGMKMATVQADMFNKGVQAGRDWSEAMRPQLERRIRERLEAEGFDREPGPNAEPSQ